MPQQLVAISLVIQYVLEPSVILTKCQSAPLGLGFRSNNATFIDNHNPVSHIHQTRYIQYALLHQ